MYGLFHARRLRAHEVALRLGWDALHRRLGVTEAFYGRFTPAISTRDFRLEAPSGAISTGRSTSSRSAAGEGLRASARPIPGSAAPYPSASPRGVAHPDQARRGAADDGVRGHLPGHDRIGADDAVVADRDPAQDACPVAHPDVVAQPHIASCRSLADGSDARPRRRRGRSRSASRRSAIRHSRPIEMCWKAEIVHSCPSTLLAPIRTSPSCTRILLSWPIHDQRPSRRLPRGPISTLAPGHTKHGPSVCRREPNRSLSRISRANRRA